MRAETRDIARERCALADEGLVIARASRLPNLNTPALRTYIEQLEGAKLLNPKGKYDSL